LQRQVLHTDQLSTGNTGQVGQTAQVLLPKVFAGSSDLEQSEFFTHGRQQADGPAQHAVGVRSKRAFGLWVVADQRLKLPRTNRQGGISHSQTLHWLAGLTRRVDHLADRSLKVSLFDLRVTLEKADLGKQTF